MQILRVVPYSATQLYSYEVLKKRFQNEKGEMSIPTRLACGGLAGMVATLVSLAHSLHFCSGQCSSVVYTSYARQNMSWQRHAVFVFELHIFTVLAL